MAMGVNSQHQELVPNVMKNPSFSLPIIYLFFDLASLLQEEQPNSNSIVGFAFFLKKFKMLLQESKL